MSLMVPMHNGYRKLWYDFNFIQLSKSTCFDMSGLVDVKFNSRSRSVKM